MTLYLNFPTGWYIALAMVYVPYLILFILRKSYKKKSELKAQFAIASIVLLIAFAIEFVAISLGLWTYFPGNWPLPLWLGYFGAGLLGFQLLKTIEKLIL